MQTINLKDFATTLAALRSCISSNNTNKNPEGELWTDVWQEKLDKMMEALPHGSGFDVGFKLNDEQTEKNKIVFDFSYTHYNDAGFNMGMTDYSLIITPSFTGYNLEVTGKDVNFCKSYFLDTFYEIFV